MSQDYKKLFYSLLEELEEKGESVAQIARISGITADRLRKLRKKELKFRMSDWEKLNTAYNEDKESVEDKLEELNKKQQELMEKLLEKEKHDQENLDLITKLLGKDGELDQAFAVLAKEHGVSIEEVKRIFINGLNK